MDAEVAYAAWQAEEEKVRQKNIITSREYFDGDHGVPLTERQREWLGFNLLNERFALNYCRIIVNAVVDRLIVTGFSDNQEEPAEWAWEWWQANRMDALQRTIHQGCVRDGEYFVMVDLDKERGLPRFYPQPRYTDTLFGGTGFGCKAHYTDEHDAAELEYASKRWTETRGEGAERKTVQRMNLYYPDRIEKYEMGRSTDESGWVQLSEEPWLTTAGEPVGIPVIHFRNPSDRSELWDAIPPQDAINKTALDILAAADANGFRIMFTKGFYPTTDGEAPDEDGDNYLEIFPGCILGHPNPEVGIDVFDPIDLSSMLAGLDNLVLKLAQITDTPLSRFQLTRQVAAEGTLKQQEEPLLAKVRARQVLFGNAWEDCMAVAWRLAGAFGTEQPEGEGLLQTQWASAETRDEKEHLESLKLKSDLGVPAETLWEEMGYDAGQIAAMRAQRGEEMQQQSNIGGALLQAFERGQ